MKKYLIFITIGLIMLIAITGRIYLNKSQTENFKIISQVHYLCDNNKTIDATYYEGGPMPQPKPGEPPTPTGKVTVVLSDERTLELKQTISADGIRYSNGNPMINGDETFIFWSKGNTALVLENNEEKDYRNCIAASQ